MPLIASRFELRNPILLALGATVLLSILFATAPARAEDDDEDDAPDTKILRSILKGVGLRDNSPNIDYRERSPLVIPQNKKLSPPETAAAVKDPNWPIEPEVKRERELKAAAAKKKIYGRETGDAHIDQGRVLTPDELAAGGRSNTRAQGTDNPEYVSGKPLPPREGSKGIFSSLFGKGDNETAPFTGEPPRANLTEPPSGYRTPSPAQPYGLGREDKTPPKAIDYLESKGDSR
ncbi:MAG: hypothetical protein JO237_00270 [Pseudolabrys sp.]|nr:hypothetical protein [Pseudolabrys sp.]